MISLRLRDRTVGTDRPAFVMGIVNATPDSFWDKSRGGAEHALRLIDEGADILDVGGESSRPGSAYVDAAEEVRRIVPVIEAIRRRSAVPISVDTRKKEVLAAALDAGADMLNDISALEDDAEIGPFAAAAGIPVVLMHKRGTPDTMQDDARYADAFAEVDGFLRRRAAYAESLGIPPDKIIVDPGIGFGKELAANVALIGRCGQLCGGRYRVLMALSRKSCIGEMTGRPVGERLAGTLAADMLSVLAGAQLVRVHDVAPAVDTLSVMGYI
ncbi:MAG: dihydropteroate synthase, partial [Treponemataceae bacterium]|nr:dihydropteroate synthase [Treponemataceae bacterium]